MTQLPVVVFHMIDVNIDSQYY